VDAVRKAKAEPLVTPWPPADRRSSLPPDGRCLYRHRL